MKDTIYQYTWLNGCVTYGKWLKSKGLWYNKGTKLRNGGLTNGKSKMV